ncbi:unnamed protein product [Ceutorhynchus assimilis]|uniref:Sodium channel protein Nach n=1 Tax=Ceutorhynchus assimilis TaxID=467358 RepID=A0A9N9N2A1_9CUCU|nr:unnamed protein product [Ceutorhynchus assimilis]
MVKSFKLKTIKSALVCKWVQFCWNTSLHGWKYFVLPKISRLEREQNSSNVEWLANNFRLFLYLLSYDNHDPPVSESLKLLEVLKRNGLSEEEVFQWNASQHSSSNNFYCRCFIIYPHLAVKCSRNVPGKTLLPLLPFYLYVYLEMFDFTRQAVYFSSAQSHRRAKQPRRTSSCGFQTGLELLIDNNPDNYFATIVPSIGFNVLIHNPYDYPNEAVNNILCEMNTNNFIGINPEIISATKNIRSRSIAVRKCLFANEKKLAFFSKYTFHNCLAECKIELIESVCNCTPFYIYDNTRNTKLCSFEDFKCILHNALYWTLESEKCDCLPTCDSTSYVPESSKGILDSSYLTNMFNIVSGMETENHTLIRVFFNDLLGTKHRRDVLFTWHMLMGSYGGILGLFTGFSFMLVVEIIYHFLVRRLKDDKKENR